MTSTTPEHTAPAGTVEAQLMLIVGGKMLVNDTMTIEKGCYSLDVTLTPKDCCKAPEEAPAIGTLTRGEAPAFA